MSLRLCVVVIGLFVSLFIIKEMLPKKFFIDRLHFRIHQPADPRKLLVGQLSLRRYEAFAAGDLSLCREDRKCLQWVKLLRSWVCAAGVCEQTDKSKKPVDCFEGVFHRSSKEDQEQINSSMCSLIGSPGTVTRQAFLSHVTNVPEEFLVEYGAYLLALKGSAAACEDYIKNYMDTGSYQGRYKWYRKLSGCRILARERTLSQEEKDFYTWFGVAQGLSRCSDIVNSQMRILCNAPGPVPVMR